MKTHLTITPKIEWLIKEFDKDCDKYVYKEGYTHTTNISIPLVHSLIEIYTPRHKISSILTIINYVEGVICTLKYNGNVTLQGEEITYWNKFMSMVYPMMEAQLNVPFTPQDEYMYMRVRDTGNGEQ